MKTLTNTFICLFIGLLFCGSFFSCRKEVGPKLILTVLDAQKHTLRGAVARAYPKDATDRPWKKESEQIDTTNNSGRVDFSYSKSVVMNVDVYYPSTRYDSIKGKKVPDTLYGSEVYILDAKKQSSSENEYVKKIIVKSSHK